MRSPSFAGRIDFVIFYFASSHLGGGTFDERFAFIDGSWRWFFLQIKLDMGFGVSMMKRGRFLASAASRRGQTTDGPNNGIGLIFINDQITDLTPENLPNSDIQAGWQVFLKL